MKKTEIKNDDHLFITTRQFGTMVADLILEVERYTSIKKEGDRSAQKLALASMSGVMAVIDDMESDLFTYINNLREIWARAEKGKDKDLPNTR